MNHFLFITHITPQLKRSTFRQQLIDLYYTSLKNQTYQSWSVIIFGDEPAQEDQRFHIFPLSDGDISIKHNEIAAWLNDSVLKSILNRADYIIKLDDDDIINPTLLERLQNFDGDVFFDEYHTFVDTSSGTITCQKRPWIASTCVHKKSHALATWSGEGAGQLQLLLYSDHSKAWHRYYADKQKIVAPKEHPVYLRVLSPTSITAGTQGNFDAAAREKYYQYLAQFGDWQPSPTTDFTNYRAALATAWLHFSGNEQQSLPRQKRSFWKKIFG